MIRKHEGNCFFLFLPVNCSINIFRIFLDFNVFNLSPQLSIIFFFKIVVRRQKFWKRFTKTSELIRSSDKTKLTSQPRIDRIRRRLVRAILVRNGTLHRDMAGYVKIVWFFDDDLVKTFFATNKANFARLDIKQTRMQRESDVILYQYSQVIV